MMSGDNRKASVACDVAPSRDDLLAIAPMVVPELNIESNIKSLGSQTPDREYPFSLMIWIHSGSTLPVCEIMTSNPYVIIHNGDALISKSKTVYQNCDPKWIDENHVIKLLHTNSVVRLRVYDERNHKNDLPMGDVLLYPSKMQYQKLVSNVTLPLVQIRDAVPVQGSITISYQLCRLEDLIRMKPIKVEEVSIPSNVKKYLALMVEDLAIDTPVENEMNFSLVM